MLVFLHIIDNLVNLVFNMLLLILFTHENFLKLAMADNNCIVLTCCNLSDKAFSVFGLKIFFICHHNVRRRIELHKLSPDLPCQMIRYNKKGFCTHSKSFRLHRTCYHFKSLPCTDHMGKKRISPIENSCDGIFLMFIKSNSFSHAFKA